jgi:hypothetical protein
MQIIIIQSEIEQAIRDYVNARLKVADGNEIIIDLAATRGDKGFTATIDIVAQSGQAAPAPTPAPAPAPAADPAPKKETKAESIQTASTASVKLVPKAEVVSQGKEEAPVDGMTDTSAPTNTTSDTKAAGEPAPAAADAAPSSTEAPYKPAEGSQAAEINAAAPAAPARSLFAGLKKPVNS